MSNASITAIFERSDEAKAALDLLKTANHQVYDRGTMLGALIEPPFNYGTKNSVLKSLVGWTLVGGACGATAGYFALLQNPTFSMPMLTSVAGFVAASINTVAACSAMAYASVGAPIGLLIGGFADVLFGGSLDDRSDDDVAALTVTAHVQDSQEEALITRLFKECGCLQIETNEDSCAVGHSELQRLKAS